MKDKLSYLTKYGSFLEGNVSEKLKKKKKEKKKEKKKAKKRKENETLLRDLDEDDHLHDSSRDDNSYGEDGPVICTPEGLFTTNVDAKVMQLKAGAKKSSFVPVDDSGAKITANDAKFSRGARNRYDSEEDSDIEVFPRRNRTKRDSSSESNLGEQRRKYRGKYDSEKESDADDKRRRKGRSRQIRRRYSSSPSPETRKPRNKRRRRHDSSSDEDDASSDNNSRNRIPSTTYRDSRTGLKVDMQDRYENVVSNHNKDQLRNIELNKGKVQKEQEEELKLHRKYIKTQSFARTVDDLDTETGIKDKIRAEDPMAMHALRRRKAHGMNTKTKPEYKGPPAKPNRFNIKPGYRWDGVDRGNNFEDRVLSLLYSQAQHKEDAYKWSTADM